MVRFIATGFIAITFVAMGKGQPGGFGVQLGPIPHYYSGTNCRASGSAQIGEPITHAYLKLNGEVVAEYHYGWQPEEPFILSARLAVMFDSTHWPTGTIVEVRFEVFGLYSQQWYYATGYAPTWNKAMIFQHPDPGISDDTWQTVSGFLSGKNYAFTVGLGAWSEPAYFDAMNGSNVVFYAGHGMPGMHWAGDNSDIFWYEYEYHRMNHIGGGVPPFNDGAPIINFIHLLACNCGDNNDFIRACWPYYMAWGGPWLKDQALFAYSVYVLLAEYPGSGF